MIILAHRGLWKKKNEQNTLAAFRRAIDHGYGIETDIRDYNNKLVIAHDLPSKRSIEFIKLLDLVLNSENKNIYLAINIKSDGLKDLIKKEKKLKKLNHFFFDMSIPQQKLFNDCKINYFIRLSELENYNNKVRKNNECGVWLDSFFKIWYNNKIIKNLRFKNIAIVSSELHKRKDYKVQWKMLNTIKTKKNLFLCTDFPIKADNYFNEKKKN